MELEHQSVLGYKELDRVLQDMASDDLITMRISGDCMVPVLQDQELVQVRRQSWYSPGDILAVRLGGGQLVSHRLIGIYPRRRQLRFLTRADNAKRPDGSVTREQILGKIVSGEWGAQIAAPSLLRRLNISFRFGILVIDRLKKRVLDQVQ